MVDLPSHVLLAIANLLPRPDIRELSLTCKKFREPSQSCLFKDMKVSMKTKGRWPKKPKRLIQFFRRHRHLVPHVRRLLLEGNNTDSHEDMMLTFPECIRILDLLPNLRRLELQFIDFACLNTGVKRRYRHPSLKAIILNNVREVGKQASTLEIARIASPCRVEMNNVSRIVSSKYRPLRTQLELDVLLLVDRNIGLGRPMTGDEMNVVGLRALGIADVASWRKDLLGPMLTNNADSLRHLMICLSPSEHRKSSLQNATRVDDVSVSR